MPNLDYQQWDQTSRETWNRRRLMLFGVQYRDVWSAVAKELGGTYQRRRWTKPDRIDASVGPWRLTLDLFTDGESVSTRLRAPYLNADGFRFHAFRKHLFSGLAERLGFQDVIVGHPEFDDAFIIRGNSELRLRELFANNRLRELLIAQPRGRFEVRDDDGWFHQVFPEGVDELRFVAPGLVRDFDRLKGLFNLFGETLRTLVQIGSTYEVDPDVRLER